jgi:hypothetical protein
MGGLVHLLKRIRVTSLVQGLERGLPRYRQDAISLNEAAIRRGIEAVERIRVHG